MKTFEGSSWTTVPRSRHAASGPSKYSRLSSVGDANIHFSDVGFPQRSSCLRRARARQRHRIPLGTPRYVRRPRVSAAPTLAAEFIVTLLIGLIAGLSQTAFQALLRYFPDKHLVFFAIFGSLRVRHGYAREIGSLPAFLLGSLRSNALQRLPWGPRLECAGAKLA